MRGCEPRFDHRRNHRRNEGMHTDTHIEKHRPGSRRGVIGEAVDSCRRASLVASPVRYRQKCCGTGIV